MEMIAIGVVYNFQSIITSAHTNPDRDTDQPLLVISLMKLFVNVKLGGTIVDATANVVGSPLPLSLHVFSCAIKTLLSQHPPFIRPTTLHTKCPSKNPQILESSGLCPFYLSVFKLVNSHWLSINSLTYLGLVTIL